MQRPTPLHHDVRIRNRQRARSMRNAMTPAERKLWYQLRCDQIDGLRFRRQHLIGPFIVDFFCASLDLVVEVDGDSHTDAEQIAYDADRTEYLAAHGVPEVRFTNLEVHTNMQGVLIELRRVIADLRGPSLSPPPSPRSTGKRESVARTAETLHRIEKRSKSSQT